MSKGEDRRKKIFNKYVKNRNLLIDNKLLVGQKDIYVCPICKQFYKSIDGDNPLTLEDAPPKSLGGKADVLTCKNCNNTCGHNIDFHLTERLRELDNASFLPNTETKVKISVGEDVFNGTIKIDKKGKMSMFHSKKNNHPIKLEEKMVGLKGGDIVDLEFLKTRVIPEKLEYALLKTAYLLAFKKFGNSLIFDDCFDVIRQQLLNPEERLYPDNFWLTPPYPQEMEGVYFVCDKGFECLFVLFNLNTGYSIRKFGVFLPCPINDITLVINRLRERFEKEKTFSLTMYPLEQDDTKYLDDIKNIAAMFEWIENRIKVRSPNPAQ